MNTRSGFIALLLAAGIALSACQTPSAAPENGLAATRLESLQGFDATAPARRDLQIQRWHTAEGAQVLFVEAPELPMFDLRLTFAAGSSRDASTPGLALLTNSMLNEGIAGRDATAIAAAFEELGAQFGNGAYRDMALASLRSLSAPDKREPALALFAEVVGRPSFPPEALERIKNQVMTGFELWKQNPGKLASVELYRQLYGEHPYGHPTEGAPNVVPGIDTTQLRAFHRQAYTPGNVVIALVGDLRRAEAEAIAAKVSAALPPGPALAPLPPPGAPISSSKHIEYPSQQTHLLLAQLGIPRGHPDYPALYLGNRILGGGGFGTRLMEEVREKRGLTYGIYSGFSPMSVAGPFMVSVQTRAELADGTLALVRQLLGEFIAEGPTELELERAKRELAGSFPLSTASNADIAAQLGSIGFYGLPLTHLEDFMRDIQALSVEQVREAMARHLVLEQFVTVSAGPSVPQQPLPAPGSMPPPAPAGVRVH